MKTIVKCRRCNHIRTTTSEFLQITCSSCGYKTPNKPMKLIPPTKEEVQAIKKALKSM